MQRKSPIGVFDSGFGGMTILNAIRESMPEYDYLYLGDNARAPYGSRSFDVGNNVGIRNHNTYVLQQSYRLKLRFPCKNDGI
jgi:glutamate racemase